MDNGLVYIGQVSNITPIEGADRIESLEVVCGIGGKWRGTAQKGQLKIGDKCQVYLQDSLLPQTPDFSFMEKYNYRVRMMKFKGVPSEVLIALCTTHGCVGEDITELVGVTRYIKPIPANMSGIVYGSFPVFIPKTDELNFQIVPEIIAAMRGLKFYSSVKIDGSSATIYNNCDHFGCCSRNLELKESDSNLIWRVAKEYDLQKKLSGFNVALQFEIAGPGIQKNRLGLQKSTPFLFNVFDIDKKEYLSFNDVELWAKNSNNFPMVQIIDKNEIFDFKSDDELRKYAEGTYDNGQQREGVVIRSMIERKLDTGERFSFKVLNLNYKD